MVPHENHEYLVNIRLRDVQHLVQRVLTERKDLILVDVIEVQDLLHALYPLDETGASDCVVRVLRVVNADDLLVLPVVQRVQVGHLLDQVDVLVLRGLLQVVRVHQVHLVALVDEVLLVDVGPFVVLGQVVQGDGVDLQFGVLEALEALLELVDLHVLAVALLEVVDEVHVLGRADHDEEDLVLLVNHDVSVVEVLDLLRG